MHYVSLLGNCRAKIISPPSLVPTATLSATGPYLVSSLGTSARARHSVQEHWLAAGIKFFPFPHSPLALLQPLLPWGWASFGLVLGAAIPFLLSESLLSHLALSSSYPSKVTNGFFTIDAALYLSQQCSYFFILFPLTFSVDVWSNGESWTVFMRFLTSFQRQRPVQFNMNYGQPFPLAPKKCSCSLSLMNAPTASLGGWGSRNHWYF